MPVDTVVTLHPERFDTAIELSYEGEAFALLTTFEGRIVVEWHRNTKDTRRRVPAEELVTALAAAKQQLMTMNGQQQ
jgi:hypothetical protein